MVTAPDSGLRAGPGLEPWPGSLCCVLAQDALLSPQCLSPPRSINGYRKTVREPDEMLGDYL